MDRVAFRSEIHEQIIKSMKVLLTTMAAEPLKAVEMEENEEVRKAAEYILATRNDAEMTEEIADNLEILWEKTKNESFEGRTDIYFFDKLKEVCDSDY